MGWFLHRVKYRIFCIIKSIFLKYAQPNNDEKIREKSHSIY